MPKKRFAINNIAFSFFFLIVFLVAIPQTLNPTYAQTPPPPIPLGPPPAGLDDIEALFRRVIQVIVGLAFIALLVVLIISGIKFLTSGGEPKAVQSARDGVTWALLGILFLIIAWLVLQLISAFTGVEDLKKFNVKALCPPC